jgi:cysteine-rich repeat protein
MRLMTTADRCILKEMPKPLQIVPLLLLLPACMLDTKGGLLREDGAGEDLVVAEIDGVEIDGPDAPDSDLPDVDAADPDTADPDAADDVGNDGDTADLPDMPEPACITDDDCSDDEPCNGTETCPAGACVDGPIPAEGSPCSSPTVPVGTCRSGTCAPAFCGNGELDADEECDDNNTNDNDACTNACRFNVCGDGILFEGSEQCDPPGGATQSCLVSPCGAPGSQTCQAGCAWGPCLPGPETCNGIDDDCDGSLDVIAARVTEDPASSFLASLAWTGTELGVAWTDNRDGNYEIYFARLSPAVARIGTDSRISSTAVESWHPALAWSGAGFGVSWSEGPNNDAYTLFARMGTDGARVGSDLQVSAVAQSEHMSSLAWSGSQYGVAWTDTRTSGQWDIYFQRVASDGTAAGGNTNVTPGANGSGETSIVWTGSQYGVAWHDNRDANWEIYFARLDAVGATVGSQVRVTSNGYESKHPALAWTGSEFAVAWTDLRDGAGGEIYFARLTSAGAKTGGDVRITNDAAASAAPSLAWGGTHYGLAWEDGRDGNAEIYFAWISPAGAKEGLDFRVTRDGAGSSWPSVAWSGTSFYVAWHDGRDGNWEIYFARILCN